jgi:hypothetical protein
MPCNKNPVQKESFDALDALIHKEKLLKNQRIHQLFCFTGHRFYRMCGLTKAADTVLE